VHDTFWYGLLLGGCGAQLTTKLYTDRVCHFAHHPGLDGHPHPCGRHARGVNSADHLYVKSQVTAWLHSQGDDAGVDFARPDGAPIGSVVDIRFNRGGLRVHLDQTVPPQWDGDEDGREPVLGVSVPADRNTLIRRWYVHRIRLDSQGTTRTVRIGTEAYARPVEWFALDECQMTEQGLSTPAAERIIRSRSTRPALPWTGAGTRKGPDTQARAQALLRKLADARRVESVVVVTRACRDIGTLTGVDEQTQAQLAVAVLDAQDWLKAQALVRRELFARPEEAVASQESEQVRQLLVRVNATASHDRTGVENVIVDAAAEQVPACARKLQAAQAAAREDVRIGRATDRVDAYQCQQIDTTKTGAGLDRLPRVQASRPASRGRAPRPKQKPLLHEQVAQRSWFNLPCPRCHAAKGRHCLNDDGIGNGSQRQFPHDERLRLIISKRNSRPELSKQASRKPPMPWQVVDVACPDCNALPGRRCTTANGRPHQSRVKWFRRRFPSR
jgi:hypothetical protein